MAGADPTAPRTIAPVPGSTRPDVLVHALAQLPNAVSLRLAEPPSRALETVIDAYGLRDRIASGAGADVEADPDAAVRSGSFAGLVEPLYDQSDPPASARRGDDSLFRGERFALAMNIPAPYRIPLFRLVAERLEAAGAEMLVLFQARSSARDWMNVGEDLGFPHAILRSASVPRMRRSPSAPVDLERRLRAFSPTAVVAPGFSPFVALRLARWAARARVSFGVWAGETPVMPTAQGRLRLATRALIVRPASFLVSYGFAAGEYMRMLGPDLPLVYARNTSPPGLPADRARIERGERVRLLAVGDLNSPRKGIDVVVRALALRPDLPCELTVIGSGRALSDLERTAVADERVRFLGARSPADVRAAYAEADAFVFPSRRDVFGLVVVEAMGAGLPVATAAPPGVVADLCLDGWNSIVVPTHEPADWAAAIERLASDPSLRQRLGQAARLTVDRRWTIEHSADALVAALRLAVLTRPRA